MRKLLSLLAIGLGVLLLVSAAIVRFAVAPAKAVLPSDTDTTRTYGGTAATLFNPAALTQGGPALLTNVPITATHRDQVLGTKGDNALVADTKTVIVNNSPVSSVAYRYAIDRKNLGAGSGFADVSKQNGITFNWPVRTNKHDYTGWVSDTQQTTPLKYAGTAKRGGISTYVFTTTTQPAPISDNKVLAALPSGLPKSTLAQLASSLGLPAATLQQLQAVLPSLPDVVPFKYTYQVTATYYVAPKSGIVVDLNQHEVRTLVLSIGGQDVPVTPIMDLTFTSTKATLAQAVSDAKDKTSAINLIYVGLPLGLAIGGLLLVLVGGAGVLLRRRSVPAGGGSDGRHERIEPIGTPTS
jgi:hypothetical protein